MIRRLCLTLFAWLSLAPAAPLALAAAVEDRTYAAVPFAQAWAKHGEALSAADEAHPDKRYRFKDGTLEVRLDPQSGPFPLLIFTRPGMTRAEALAIGKRMAPPDMDYAHPRTVPGEIVYRQKESESGAVSRLTLTVNGSRVDKVTVFNDEP
jgi:hypothetical protein